jgi:hypothetical protein
MVVLYRIAEYDLDMNSEAAKRLLQEQPFLPLEVRMSSGKSYIIRHPECAAVGKNTLVIIDPETDVVHHCSLMQVTDVVRR